jgi:hypothetical protein
VLGADGSEAARCPGELMPPRITKRFERLRATVARIAQASTERATAKRVRSALRAADRTVVRIDREAARQTILESCRAGLVDLVETARGPILALAPPAP